MRNSLAIILILAIVFSLTISLYIIVLNIIYIDKGSLHMYENSPVSYINKPIDLNSSDLIQKYEFKNTILGKHSIEVKIISESLPAHIFNGEYRISIHDSQNKLVKDFFSATNLNKDWYRIHLTTYWSDELHKNYYKFGEIELNKLDSFTVNIENIKGVTSTGKGEYQIGIYPFEYNYAIQKQRFYISVLKKLSPYIIVFIVSVICLIRIFLNGCNLKNKRSS